jgi:hypothetical protein
MTREQLLERLIESVGVLIWVTIVSLAVNAAVMVFASIVTIGYLVTRLI